MINLSDKQEEMLAFIENFVMQHGYPPTREEIRTALDISTKSLVNYHLEVLENADFLKRIPNTPRGLRLMRENMARTARPAKAANRQLNLSELEYNDGEILELTYGAVTNNSNMFALKIEPDVMTDASLTKGDIVILQDQQQAANGDLVLVRHLKKKTLMLRRYFCENGRIRLEPADAKLEPLFLNIEEVQTQGKVVAIIRQLETEEMIA
jgi:repressor LexA